uniref:Reverse transcriptase zinc-binding domain-containing protein n=1 Tax=Arundo donax TaxID=35708 RepID=A0A0A8ZPB4_ARUDO
MWLALLNFCWTADRLAKHGLPDPSCCPLCDQHDETMQHLLISCMVPRQVWLIILQKAGLQLICLSIDHVGFSSWWSQSLIRVDKHKRKGLNSLIILVAWELWKHRNDCVFNAVSLDVHRVVKAVEDEGTLWCAAGASKLGGLSSGAA